MFAFLSCFCWVLLLYELQNKGYKHSLERDNSRKSFILGIDTFIKGIRALLFLLIRAMLIFDVKIRNLKIAINFS